MLEDTFILWDIMKNFSLILYLEQLTLKKCELKDESENWNAFLKDLFSFF